MNSCRDLCSSGSEYIITFLVVVQRPVTYITYYVLCYASYSIIRMSSDVDTSGTNGHPLVVVLSTSIACSMLLAVLQDADEVVSLLVMEMRCFLICPRHHQDGKCISTTRPDITPMLSVPNIREMERSGGVVGSELVYTMLHTLCIYITLHVIRSTTTRGIDVCIRITYSNALHHASHYGAP